jgi:cysteinyl-tRNA synthetase
VTPAVLRLALLDRAWASAWNYDDEVLTAAANRVDALYASAARAGDGAPGSVAEVTDALLSDLDVTRAVDAALDSRGGEAARLLIRLLGLPA